MAKINEYPEVASADNLPESAMLVIEFGSNGGTKKISGKKFVEDLSNRIDPLDTILVQLTPDYEDNQLVGYTSNLSKDKAVRCIKDGRAILLAAAVNTGSAQATQFKNEYFKVTRAIEYSALNSVIIDAINLADIYEGVLSYKTLEGTVDNGYVYFEIIEDADINIGGAYTKEYVTPEMYGAIGDGSTDDRNAFQSAINTGKPIFLSAKTYYISTALSFNHTSKQWDNSTYYQVTMIGCGRGQTNIKLGSHSITNSPLIDSVFSGISFYPATPASVGYAFGGKLNNTIVEHCEFQNFYNIFSRLELCCKITGNWFRSVKRSLCTQCSDSFITDNYLSGSENTVFFAPNGNTVSTLGKTVIQGNFFSYCYKVFEITSTMNAVVVSGNIFALCYCIFYNQVSGVTFTGNTINYMTKAQTEWENINNADMTESYVKATQFVIGRVYFTRSGSAPDYVYTKVSSPSSAYIDDYYEENNWSVIKRKNDSDQSYHWVDSVFADNSIIGDFDMYLDCVDLKSPTFNFLVDEIYDASKFNYRVGATKNPYANNLENVMIRPMLKRTVTGNLPDPQLSSAPVVSFNHDEVIYNGDPYINVNGTWKHIPTGDGYLTLATLPIYNGGVQ